jgi:single-strand DNA-binding protein
MFNQVQLIGNVGTEPTTNTLENGSKVTTFDLATSETYTKKGETEKTEITTWHRITLFGKLAEIAEKHVKKSKQLFIQGKIKNDSYTNKDDVKVYTTEIVADEMRFLGKKES